MDGRRPADYGSGLRTTLCGRNHLHLLRSVATGLRLLRTLGSGRCPDTLQPGPVLLPCRVVRRELPAARRGRTAAGRQAGQRLRPGGIPSMPRLQLPEAFRRWDADSELPRCPLLPETPRDDALTLILRLRAEAASRLGRCEEVRTIAARLGHRYKHLENLLKPIDR